MINLTFGLLCLVYFSLLLGLYYSWKNWGSLKQKADKFWNGGIRVKTTINEKGEVVVVKKKDGGDETEDFIGMRDQINWGKLIGIVFRIELTSFMLLIINDYFLGPFGLALMSGLGIAILVAITSKERNFWGVGLAIGTACFFLTWAIPAITEVTLKKACYLGILILPVNYALEEISKKNVFPRLTVWGCAAWAAICIIQAGMIFNASQRDMQTLATIWLENNQASSVVDYLKAWQISYPPLLWGYTEGTRYYYLIASLSLAVQWLAISGIVYLIALPGEIMNWMDKANIGKKFSDVMLAILGFLGITRRRKI